MADTVLLTSSSAGLIYVVFPLKLFSISAVVAGYTRRISRGQESPSAAESTFQGQCHCAVAAFCFLLAVIAAMAVAATIFVVFTTGTEHANFLAAKPCRRPGCLAYATLLRRTLNMSVDPCHDFGAFVASHWLPEPSSAGHLAYRLQWDVRTGWASWLAEGIRERRFSAPMMDVVASSLAACEQQPPDNDASGARRTLKELMRKLSIPWPEAPPRDCRSAKRAAGALRHMAAALVVRRQDVTVRRQREQRGSWDGLYREISYGAAESKYIEPFVEAFSDPDATNRERVDHRKVHNITKRVVARLARACAERHSTALTLDAFADRLGAPLGRLTAVLNHLFQRSNESFSRDDVVVVKSMRVIEIVRQTLRTYDAPAILSHLGWWLLQIYAPLADQSFVTHKYGEGEIGMEAKVPFCGSEVEQAFKIVLLSGVVTRYFPPQARQSVDLLLDSVQQAVTNTAEISPLISPAREVTSTR
ncbi:hypothetical protein HPB48_019239 [Haemaphysalis longicornis]|uniref:Uncharacterized protein n=1 Tax=Haemaphysalis longicornis TaxID=44386 RepID=A0A9J6GTM0_HAELO|nr:hypothetical protein HPB48_019239 [Haemaphysalis longicornis]